MGMPRERQPYPRLPILCLHRPAVPAVGGRFWHFVRPSGVLLSKLYHFHPVFTGTRFYLSGSAPSKSLPSNKCKLKMCSLRTGLLEGAFYAPKEAGFLMDRRFFPTRFILPAVPNASRMALKRAALKKAGFSIPPFPASLPNRMNVSKHKPSGASRCP